MLNTLLAGSKPAPGVPQFIIAILLLASPSFAADPYVSKGLLEFPKEVEVGLMSAVSIDGDDNIYVLHRGEPPIVQFEPNGRHLRNCGQGLFKVPHGLRALPNGQFWTTDNGNHVIRKFTPVGNVM